MLGAVSRQYLTQLLAAGNVAWRTTESIENESGRHSESPTNQPTTRCIEVGTEPVAKKAKATDKQNIAAGGIHCTANSCYGQLQHPAT